jgi:hypothetical protein
MRKIIIYILIIFFTGTAVAGAIVLVKRNEAPKMQDTVVVDDAISSEETHEEDVQPSADKKAQEHLASDATKETTDVNYEYLDRLADAFYTMTDADGMERIDEQRAIEVTQITPEMWDERGVYKYKVAEIARTISMEIEIYDEPDKIGGELEKLKTKYGFAPTEFVMDHSDITGTFYENTYMQNNGITAYCGLYTDGESYIIMYFSHDRIYELGEQRLIDFARTAQQLKGELINE